MRKMTSVSIIVATACLGFAGLFLLPGTAAATPPEELARRHALYLDVENVKYHFHDQKVAALALCAARGDVKEIDRLVAQGADPNAQGLGGKTPLVWAMKARSKEGFKRLLDRGAKFDYKINGEIDLDTGPPDRCLTFAAAGDEDDSEWLEILLRRGANPNRVRPKWGDQIAVDYTAGRTPIFPAATSGRAQNVDILVKAGADINHQDNFGRTPLIDAAWQNKFKMVLHLLELGADYRIRANDDGDLAYEMALAENPDGRSPRDDEVRKIIAFLEKRGIDMAAARKKAAPERERRRQDIQRRAIPSGTAPTKRK